MKKVSDMDARISLSADFMAEVHWWCDLLPEWNGISLIYDQHWTANADFKQWTDASGVGFGAYLNGAHLLGEFSSWARTQSTTFKGAVRSKPKLSCCNWSRGPPASSNHLKPFSI